MKIAFELKYIDPTSSHGPRVRISNLYTGKVRNIEIDYRFTHDESFNVYKKIIIDEKIGEIIESVMTKNGYLFIVE